MTKGENQKFGIVLSSSMLLHRVAPKDYHSDSRISQIYPPSRKLLSGYEIAKILMSIPEEMQYNRFLNPQRFTLSTKLMSFGEHPFLDLHQFDEEGPDQTCLKRR